MKLGTMLDSTVLRDPGKEALVYGDDRHTFAELRQRVLKAARVPLDTQQEHQSCTDHRNQC